MKRYIFVSGIGASKEYFKSLIENLDTKYDVLDNHIDYHIYDLHPFRSINEQAVSLLLFLSEFGDSVHLIGFSLGCALIMKLLELDNVSCYVNNVTFINPSNIEMDDVDKVYYQYKIIWSSPIFIKRIFLFFYKFTTMKKLDEPQFLMENLLINHSFDSIYSTMREIGMSANWNEMIHNSKYYKRIRVITGDRDRYLMFSRMLADVYNSNFFLQEVQGQHHIIYKNPKGVSLYLG